MSTATVEIKCETPGCPAWVMLSRTQAIHIEEQEGRLLCGPCLSRTKES